MRAKQSDIKFQGEPSNWTIKHHNKVVARATAQGSGYLVNFLGDSQEIEKSALFSDQEELTDSVLDWIRTYQYDVIHISDSHGTFPTLPKGELVVCSGDFFPNQTRGRNEIEEPYQTEWLKNRIETFREWLGNRKFLWCSGNHDFINPCEILKENGIDAVNITNRHYEHKGVRFYGFPYIPYIEGEWNYELTSAEMSAKITLLKEQLARGVDVLVAHAPPHGVLDANIVKRDGRSIIIPDWAEFCGNSHLTNLLTYGIDDIPKELRPKYLLCGHIHEHHGWADLYGIQVSNAATKVHTIEIRL